MAQTKITDADGVDRLIENPLAPGRADAALSKPVALDNESKAVLDAISTKLTTLDGRVDGVETLIGTTNTTLTTIDGRVDGVEGLLTTLIGHVDGVEAAIGTTNTTLTTIDGRVDGVEAGIGATNESAAGSDTATSGLNGLFKRLLQGVTTLIARTFTWKNSDYGSATTLLSTELNSLADNAESAASSTFDNSSDRNKLADFELNLAATSARAADNVVLLYMKVRIDGTNFTGTNSAVARLCGAFVFDAATTTWRGGLYEVPLPPEQLQFFLRNQLGVAFASSASTLKIRAYSPVSV